MPTCWLSVNRSAASLMLANYEILDFQRLLMLLSLRYARASVFVLRSKFESSDSSVFQTLLTRYTLVQAMASAKLRPRSNFSFPVLPFTEEAT